MNNVNNKDEFNIKQKLQKINSQKSLKPKRKTLLNVVKSFLVGGGICLICELVYFIFHKYISKEASESYAIIIMIFMSSLLTGFGLYDKIGDFGGCGSIVPITGFANSVTSCAIEYKTEGIVLGIVNNIFKLAGSVIATAIVSGVVFGVIKYFGVMIFG